MFRIERKLIDFAEKYINIIVLTAGIILSLVLRLSMYSYIGSDMRGYLLGWFEQIRQLGGIHALKTQVGNYSVAYQTLISIMTYIPMDPVAQYKNLSVFFDYVLASGVAMIVFELAGRNRNRSLAAFLLVLFSPIVFINSAAWGQCDAIYSSFAVWALYFFIKEKYVRCFVLYGLACAFKLQAIFLLPFFLFAYVRKKDFSLLHFMIVPATMEAVCIPAMIMGRGIKAAFSVYYYQTFSCDCMYFGYPCIWTIMSDEVQNDAKMLEYIKTMRTAAILLCVAVLMILMFCFYLRKIQVNRQKVIYISFLFAYTCVMFLPGMHERYGFVDEILALMIAFLIPHTIPLVVLKYGLTCMTYGGQLFGGKYVNRLMGTVNLLIYAAYIIILYKRMNGEEPIPKTIKEDTE